MSSSSPKIRVEIHSFLTVFFIRDPCVSALVGHLSIPKAAISQHLQILRKAALVRAQKQCCWTHVILAANPQNI
ncbi:MAG: helix-turn-helix transcriptional regulator [Deltaproteobacteria bacterium]|nr:helix-turn-helix transcriptional regulator [Deltaproteobacteria bacterium]